MFAMRFARGKGDERDMRDGAMRREMPSMICARTAEKRAKSDMRYEARRKSARASRYDVREAAGRCTYIHRRAWREAIQRDTA